MKKIIMPVCAVMICLLFASCSNQTFDNQEIYNYKMENVYIEDDVDKNMFQQFQYHNNTLYGIAYNFDDANNYKIEIVTIENGKKNIYLNTDQTDDLGTITTFAFDNNGDMWVLSSGESYILSKVLNGNVQEQITIDTPAPSKENYTEQMLYIDEKGQFYVSFDYDAISVLSTEGEIVATISSDAIIRSFVKLNGKTFVCYDGEAGYSIAEVNIEEEKIENSITVTESALSDVCLAENLNKQYCYYDENGISIVGDDGNATSLFVWTDYGLASIYPSRIFITIEGDVLCCSWDSIIKMKRVSAEEGDQRQTLTLAAFDAGDALKSIVAEFNKTNEEYMVSIIDYSTYNTDSDKYAGLNKLNTEIIGGNPPDMIDLRNIDAEQYIFKGIMEDLYPYIDRDPNFNRKDFLENVLTAMGDDDKLYGLTTTFRINTVLAKTSEADLPNWNLVGLKDMVQSNPEIILGGTKTRLLELACTYMQDNFVDWENNTANFNTPEFIAFLETCNTLPDETEIVEIYDLLFSDAEDNSVYAGSNISNFSEVQTYEDVWGTDVSLIGYPDTGSTIGLRMYIGITTNSKHKDACWTFLRTALLSGMQEASGEWVDGFPINKSSFEKIKAQATVESDDGTEEYVINVQDPDAEPYLQELPTEEQVNKIAKIATTINQLSSNNTVIKDIVLEEAESYFDGSKSAEKVAEVIQNRVSTYMNEQK